MYNYVSPQSLYLMRYCLLMKLKLNVGFQHVYHGPMAMPMQAMVLCLECVFLPQNTTELYRIPENIRISTEHFKILLNLIKYIQNRPVCSCTYQNFIELI